MEETIQVMEEVSKVFSLDDDIETIQKIAKLQEDIAQLTKKKELSVKETIKMIASDVAELQEKAKRSAPAEVHRHKMEQMLMDKENICRDIKMIEKKKSEISEEMGKVECKLKELAVKEAQNTEKIEHDEPHTRYILTLYSHVARIKWDYDSEHIKGYVVVSQKRDVKPFHLDPTKHSQFFITNYLWDLIEC